MTPYYADEWLSIYEGDCRDVLASLPSDSVDCVVTSPPYWGLRDYGHEGQLGLERTPEEYVANMVAVFREVWRVLKPSGTCWLNLGSSYMSNGERQTGRNDNGRPEKGRGWAEYDIKRTKLASRGSGPSQSRQPERAPAYGTDGKALAGSLPPGFAYPDPCDGCRADLSNRRPRSAGTSGQPSDASPPEPTDRDSEPRDSGPEAPDVSPLDAPVSTTPRSEQPPPGECSHCGNCGACLSVLRSVGRDARLCVRRSAYSDGRTPLEPTSDDRTGDKESSGVAWGDYTSTLKPKDLVPIPWMVAMALQADGWYLRRDVIWSKPNPMPESVTDRPTSSHEYLFLLTKSARYYYDAEAIKESATYSGPNGAQHSPYGQGFTRRSDKQREIAASAVSGGDRWSGFNDRWANADRVQTRRAAELARNAGLTEAHIEAIRAVGITDTGKALVTQDGAGKNAAEVQRLADEAKAALGGYYREFLLPLSRNVRSVWTIATRPYPGAHFAVFPPELPERCIKAGCPEGGVVLDPFGGSGTVGMVANRLSRRAILIDLNPEYLKQQLQRNAQTPLGLEVA